MHGKIVYFAHGKESGPRGRKIAYLGGICEELGWRVRSPDYSGLADPEARIERLLEVCRENSEDLVLVGSSMGAYVSARAAETIKPRGLFLMAPAVFLPGYPGEAVSSLPKETVIVHGWNDDVVPVDNAIRLAKQHRCEIDVVDADHALSDALPRLGTIFRGFLQQIDATPRA